MTITTTRWTTDTCGASDGNCIIEFDADDSTNPPTISNFRPVFLCAAHASLSGTSGEKVGHVRNENARGQGNAIWQLLQAAPSSTVDILPDGSRTFKQGITITWSWSGTAPNRVLNVTITGASLTTNQQNAIKTAVDNKFGAGNIVVTFVG